MGVVLLVVVVLGVVLLDVVVLELGDVVLDVDVAVEEIVPVSVLLDDGAVASADTVDSPAAVPSEPDEQPATTIAIDSPTATIEHPGTVDRREAIDRRAAIDRPETTDRRIPPRLGTPPVPERGTTRQPVFPRL